MNEFDRDDVLRSSPRRVAQEMQRFMRERAECRASLKEWHEQAQRDLERDRTAQTEHVEIERGRRITSLKHEQAEALEREKNTFDEQETEVRRAYESDRAALLNMAGENEKKAKARLEESIWLSESVYEANEELPGEEYEQQCKLVDSVSEETERIRNQAESLLRRSRFHRLIRGNEIIPPCAANEGESLPPAEQLQQILSTCEDLLNSLRAQRLMRLFQGVAPFVILFLSLVLGAACGIALDRGDIGLATMAGAALGAAVGLAALALAYAMSRARARAAWNTIIELSSQIDGLRERAVAHAAQERDDKQRRLLETRDRETEHAKKKFGAIIEEVQRRCDDRLKRIEGKYPPRLNEISEERAKAIRRIEQTYDDKIDAAEREHLQKLEALQTALRHREQEINDRHERAWNELKQQWLDGMNEMHALRKAIQAADTQYYPDFSDPGWESWNPPHAFAPAIRFGRIDVDLPELPGGLPSEDELRIDGPERFILPATLAFPDECSLLIERDGECDHADIQLLQAVMLRLLTCVPPGKVRLTIFDPVGLGQNFAGFMHLADYNDQFVGGKIWTESRHIEQQLADLTEHMENVIQKYLRNEFETIDEYNAQAGEIAEPYRFLVIANFPANFTEGAMRRLASIINSGPRCGVHTLIARDVRSRLPEGLDLDDLRRASTCVKISTSAMTWEEEAVRELPFTPEAAPDEAFLTRIVHTVGREALESTRVEVPFEVIAPDENEAWSLRTDDILRVPLGRAGATKLQYLKLGEGTAQHALVAGKTGSGKSTLLHALITNLTLWYSPNEVELYLVDFKKGVEFKTYARHHLPHIRAVAIESDREFGISVLERLDEEMQRRGELFRQHGVQSIGASRQLGTGERMPRVLLVIDEFQEFFVEDDKIAQEAAMLLDRLVRQGRAFGMHVLLGSQTLGGAYSLARSTMGQMGVRIALQCSETDSYLILSDDNAAARLLSRPGEAIYNDSNGTVEGNSPFQVVWLPENVREKQLSRVSALARRNGHLPAPKPIVFEGNMPARLSENHLLAARIDGAGGHGAAELTAWLGDAISIKDPTAVTFRRQGGHNLLMVGQRNDAALGIVSSLLIGLAACSPEVRFYMLDGSAADSEDSQTLRELGEMLPQEVRSGRVRDVGATLGELNDELKKRQDADDTNAPPIFLFVFGLHRFRDLRHDDNFAFSMDEDGDKPPAPDKVFATLLREGPTLGIHVICWCDSASNLSRTLERQSQREFEFRVLFQMSQNDSSMLIDSPEAAKLGFHRALLSSEEQGRVEKFRPYAAPSRPWRESVRDRLAASMR